MRVDEQLRDQAQQILSQMGMDMTTAVRLFLQ
ncbi:type II toxin-antitoxin system RelB/DinJ family antitoxin [Sutterella wadsworthensis]